MSYKDDTRFYFYNYDLSKTIIDESWGVEGSNVAPTTETYERVLTSGDYYIKTWGATGNYKMYADFISYNTNDYGAFSYDSPLDFPMNYQITGARTETNTEDWFRLYVPYTGTYAFKVISYKDDTRFYLYNYDLSKTIIDESWGVEGSEVAPKTETYNKVLSAGTYYIKTWGASGKYLMSWGPLTQDNCSHEFENKTVYSTCTTQGYTSHTCKICGYSYADNYKALASHSFTSQTVYPTYFAGGYTVYKCRTCGYVYNDNFTSKLKVTKPTISSIKKGKKQFTVYLTNLYGVDGVQIQYSTSKKFPKKSTKTVSTTKSSKAVKKLKGNKKYYVRVRGYKKVDGKKAYSSWSKVKSVKTK